MFTQSVWKISNGKSTPQIKLVRTVPDLSTPQNKVKSTPKIRTSRIHWKVEQKLQEFMPSDSDQRIHDLILNSLQYMPKEIINSINLQHYQNSYQFHHRITQQELEYQLISSLEQISQEIIEPLFQKDDSNILGVADDLNPYKKYNITAIPKLIEIVNGDIESIIKFLIPQNKKLSQCIEYIWKYCVFMLDLTMQFSLDRSNKYIIEQVTKLQKKLSNAKTQVHNFENRVVKMTQEFETAIMKEKQRYYELQANYEKILAKATELERLINEDIKTEGRDDSYKLKKNVKELEANLKILESQFSKHEEEFVSQLTNVAYVAKNKRETCQAQIRNRLAMNVIAQQPGDMAFSLMFSDHPWVPIFCVRQLMQYYDEPPYVVEEDNKLELLHKVLMMEQSRVSPCQQLIDYYQKFPELYKNIITILEPFEEATQAAVQLNNLCSIFFNIQGVETIEIYYINQIKRIYQEFYAQILNVQQHSKNPEQIKLQIEMEDENLKHKIVKLNLNYGKSTLMFSISKPFLETYFSQFQIQAQLQQIFDTRKDITMLHLLSIYATELSKQSKTLFENKLQNFNVPDVDSLGKYIAYEIFPEFKLDPNLVQSYIIHRYYYLQEQQIKFNKEYLYRNQSTTSNQILDRESIINGVKQLRQSLLFNPMLLISHNIVAPSQSSKQPRRQSSVQQ
ncbi:unnamed protein product (macronuclear) [Paramecium tetraurelia]|uniref:Uncharacterized protein n=1 Tax=Paramecium tetraurelia TaxID=5888 RepID=A0CUD5_PARTE|nr:uncharacterized protein GSPATT00010602001 [Paramecium tetraurelia]CAK74402.1 unnamed protein product [Paramecium tetraurelia]|eukprot:XP_001441799.1 hypothetical protein (macronuclear) [Paramecium tetraurelia strain d4-2]